MASAGTLPITAYRRASREIPVWVSNPSKRVRDYVTANHRRLIGEYSETLSGRRSDRPQLAMALTTCRIMGAVLAIACLDRLSRNVAMIARLMDSGLDFVAIDFPYANKVTIHVLAAVAEYESRIQSERTKAILAEMDPRSGTA